MSTNNPFSGNSQKAPRAERLTSHETPLVARYERVTDIALMNMYRQVVRIPLGKVAEQSVERPVEAASDNQEFAPATASRQFENKLAETSQLEPSLDNNNGYQNAEAIQRALDNVDAAWKGN